MNNPACAETAALVAGLLVGFLDIRAIWSMDHEPEGTDAPRLRPTLLVFADTATLRRLHSTPHMPGVEVLVVTDGDAVESAWQRAQMHASLARWAWRQTSANEAFYDEARWAEDGKTVVRLRRKAQLVWQRPAGEKACAQS
jgi:hypothetical protein